MDLEQQKQLFLKGLCKHIVCISGTSLPRDGKHKHEEVFFNCSGFVMSIYGGWFLVTAGHVIKRLDWELREGGAEIVHCTLADYFGNPATSEIGIPFSYKDAKKVAIDDETLGIDIGLIGLGAYYRSLLEKNVQAIDQSTVGDLPEMETFGVLGFPKELFDRQRRIDVLGDTIVGGVRPVLMTGTRTDALPRTKSPPKTPWFAVELKDKDEIKDLDGMSGGPIFGFKCEGRKLRQYSVVAVQSFWDSERRIAFGTRLSAVLDMIDSELRSEQGEPAPDRAGM